MRYIFVYKNHTECSHKKKIKNNKKQFSASHSLFEWIARIVLFSLKWNFSMVKYLFCLKKKIYLHEIFNAFFYFFTDLPNSSTTLTLDCQETVFLESGCEIVNRKCRCWGRKKICKNLSRIKWDFINLEVRFYILIFSILNKI